MDRLRLSRAPYADTAAADVAWTHRQFGEIKVIFFIPVTPTTQATLRDLSFYTSLHQFLAPRLQELAARVGQLQVRKPAYVVPRRGGDTR